LSAFLLVSTLFIEGLGVGATVGYVDDNLFDSNLGVLTTTADFLIEIAKIQDAATLLRDSTSFLSDFSPVSNELPLVKKSINEVIAGPGRTLAELFDLTEWADGLQGTPADANGNPDFIALSELKSKIRGEFQGLTKPDLSSIELPPIPDPNVFIVTRPGDQICAGSYKSISIDVDVDANDVLQLTFCSLLQFDLTGTFDAKGLLDSIPESLEINVDGNYDLLGSLMFGCRLTVDTVRGLV
jgi:hypothetical protein